jgi:dolichyl-phosphate beta-glucosyltransferase
MASQFCIVVPCYNEEDRLNLDLFEAYLQQHPEICFAFINDGSKDKTLELIQDFSAKIPQQVKAVDLAQNSGKAEAVRQGMLAALAWKDFEYIGFWDADLATPLSQIELLLKNIQKNPEYVMVLGSRIPRLGSRVKRNPKRRFFGRLFANIISLMMGVKIHDTQCGAKIFDTKLVAELFDQPFLTKWFFDVELLVRLSKKDGGTDLKRVAIEVPLEIWEEVGGSKIGLSTFLKVPLDLWRIYRNYRPLKVRKK